MWKKYLDYHQTFISMIKKARSFCHLTILPCCFLNVWRIGDFRNVFKFHAYSVNKRLFLTTAKLVQGLSDIATTNVCKVDTSNRNHIERSRWMKWLSTGPRQKKYPFIWIHYESGLLLQFSFHLILYTQFFWVQSPVSTVRIVCNPFSKYVTSNSKYGQWLTAYRQPSVAYLAYLPSKYFLAAISLKESDYGLK